MKNGSNQGNISPVSRRSLLASAASMALVGCASVLLGRPNAAVAQSTAALAGQTHINSIGIEFTLIRAGSFMMGSPDSDREAREFEKPQHQATISKPFYLGRYEVTQEQWEAVMGSNPYTLDRLNPFYSLPGMAERITRPNHPATVSWIDAQQFIAHLNEREGGNRYRLPTEAEWEYAARAGTTTAYSFGDNNADLGRHAWYGEDFNSGGSTPSGRKSRTPGAFTTFMAMPGNGCRTGSTRTITPAARRSILKDRTWGLSVSCAAAAGTPRRQAGGRPFGVIMRLITAVSASVSVC